MFEVSYNRLWKLLIDRRLKKKDLQKMTRLSSAVIAKMGRNETVHLETLAKVCCALECTLSEIVDIHVRQPE